jgi:dienelactone hydrolase
LVFNGDAAVAMVEGIHSYLDRETARIVRPAPDRERLRRMIGAADPRVEFSAPELVATTAKSAELAPGIFAVRWPVFADMDAEGLLIQPVGTPKARIVAIPDADSSPEVLAARYAGSGCQVLIPVVIDRKDTWSGIPGVRMTNQPHREWIYRMAFEAGRHIIGYEVQKVLAAVDWFAKQGGAPIAVAGYGEGGLLALYAAALDTRIDTALVSGHLQPREAVSQEPIYRDVWGLLREFGDAELARLVAPRRLIVEASGYPEVARPPVRTAQRNGATPNGALTAPPIETVRLEVARAGTNIELLERDGTAALLRLGGTPAAAVQLPRAPDSRMHRQFDQMVAHTQAVIRASDAKRAAFWSQGSPASKREYVWNEVIGRLPAPSAPANPRSRLIYDEPKFRGYEVMLDVWPGVFAYGILLVPKDIKNGERRPVVVCQHGLEGRPRDVADPKLDVPAYHRFAARLAEEGFITFAPQNPYTGEDRFRQIQRKGHPLKLSLFSFILGQHQRILEWLGGLPYVDVKRIGFYGLSYGGKTAMRVPPLLEGYALSICSADFNEWVWKTTSADSRYSYMLTGEYDMLEWDFANVVNYSDLASLMAPRPFMVERGHDDGVAPDEWVAYEYAKVRRFYDKAGIGDRTEIEFFEGPHTIHGVGTFAFLRKHLNWPRMNVNGRE